MAAQGPRKGKKPPRVPKARKKAIRSKHQKARARKAKPPRVKLPRLKPAPARPPEVGLEAPAGISPPEREVRVLVASFLEGQKPEDLGTGDLLGEGGYGFSKQRLQTLAEPLSRISKMFGGSEISIVATAKAKTLGDLVKLVGDAIS